MPWSKPPTICSFLASGLTASIPGTHYSKAGDEFRMPICSSKLASGTPKSPLNMNQILNDKYLVQSTLKDKEVNNRRLNDSQKCMLMTEHEMYRFDSQIENYRKCERIVKTEMHRYNCLS